MLLAGYFAVNGFPPSGEVAGTMADTTGIAGVEPAERYSADAISEEDVQLDDQTINDLLQDPDVVALISDQGFQNALTEGRLTEAMSVNEFSVAMSEGLIENAVKEAPGFRDALMQNTVSDWLTQANERSIAYPRFNRLSEVLSDARIRNALHESVALRNFLAESGSRNLRMLSQALSENVNFRTALETGLLENAMKEGRMSRLDRRSEDL